MVVPLFLASMWGSASASAGQDSIKGAAVESHEGMTISVQPWTEASQYKDKFSKKSPLSGGVVAMQATFRNNSDESMRITVSRVRLTVRIDPDNSQELQPLTADELADAVLKPVTRDPTARRKLPIPTSSPKNRNDKHWIELQREAQDAALPSAVVAAHGSIQGLLYFDLQGQFDLLDAAHLYVPEITKMGSNQPLTYFDVNLGRRAPNQ